MRQPGVSQTETISVESTLYEARKLQPGVLLDQLTHKVRSRLTAEASRQFLHASTS